MSYIRAGHELRYFEGESNSYVFLAGAENVEDYYVEDYDDNYEDDTTFAELLLRFIGRATEWRDEKYLYKIAGVLEKKLGVKRRPKEQFGKTLIGGEWK